jgi:hypothetical protein
MDMKKKKKTNCGVLRHVVRGYDDIIYTEELEEFMKTDTEYLLCTTSETIDKAMRSILNCLMSTKYDTGKIARIHFTLK